ncbi:MAG: hypothetical protein K8H90_02675, partial [Thermoanaerobaculia bacterium]|nr:hypothetical protein [Thermoanaerobaculia bacterium]
TTHYHVDHLGTPRLLTDVNGAAVGFHAYFPYGEAATDPAQDRIRYKFTGHERDLGDPTSTEDDLDHMHARMTNPRLGRFLSVDPVQQMGRAQRMPQLWNRYAYAVGNPLKYIDPTGAAMGSPAADKADCGGLAALSFSCLKHAISDWLEAAFPPPAADPRDPNVQALMEVYGEAKEHPTNLAGNVQQGLIEGTAEITARTASTGLTVFLITPGLAGRGSTASLRNGSTLARNLREQLAIRQARLNPTAGRIIVRELTDSRWLPSEGWVKMQQIVRAGGREGPINVHYVYNRSTGAIDDFKIILQGGQ